MWLTAVEYSHEGFLACMRAIFEPLWDGLTTYNIPGTNWPIAGFFLAIMTAGLIGKLMKHLFAGVFNSHFEDGFRGGRKSADDD